MAEEIEDLSWVEDGIDRNEFNAVRGLIRLANEGYGERLLEEPWVVEGKNFPALESLWYLAVNNTKALSKIMSHPTISDGISEQEAKIIATLHGVDSDILDTLLDPKQVSVEERAITLPLAGETELTIIRTRPGTDLTMDLLEHSVRTIEEFMGFPLPRKHVIYLFDNVLDVRGRNYFTHVSIKTHEEVNRRQAILELLAHEAAHYYWRGHTSWISEGSAHLMASVSADTLEGPLISLPCPCFRSIAEFEEQVGSACVGGSCLACTYSFGERLFRDLHRTMDETTFRQAFRRLFLHTSFDVQNQKCDAEAGICQVEEAFEAYAEEGKVAAVKDAISRWYDVPEPYDISQIVGTTSAPEIPVIDGRIEDAFLSLSWGGSPINEVFVGPNRNPVVYWNLDYSYGHSSGLESLPIQTVIYLDQGFGIERTETNLDILPLPSDSTRRTHPITVGFWREVGRFWVHAYSEGQKIAEITFETKQDVDPHSIRGNISFGEGFPYKQVALQIRREGGDFWTAATWDGAFDIEVPPGSYKLEVHPLFGREYVFVGWYDGSGGITRDPYKAAEIVVENGDVEGIDVTLTTFFDGNFRGAITGPGGRVLERLERAALVAIRGIERNWIDARPDGSFDAELPTGTYTIEVKILVGSEYYFVGWYDGDGSITTDPGQAFNVEIDGDVVREIEVKLPSDFYDLLCSGSSRSSITGECF